MNSEDEISLTPLQPTPTQHDGPVGVQKNIIESQRNRFFARKVQSSISKRRNSKIKFEDVCKKLTLSYDPLLTTNSFRKFLAQNTLEHEELTKLEAKHQETTTPAATSSPQIKTVEEDRAHREENASEISFDLVEKDPPGSPPLRNVSCEIQDGNTDSSPPLGLDEGEITSPQQGDIKPVSDDVNTGKMDKFRTKIEYLKTRNRPKFRDMKAAETVSSYISAKYSKHDRKIKPTITPKQKLHLLRLHDPKYRRFLSLKHPHMNLHNLHEYRAIRRNYIWDKTKKKKSRNENKKMSKFERRRERLYKRWKSRNLPKLEHNGELVREVALHSVALGEEVRGGEGFPHLTVAAADVISTAIQCFIRDQIIRNYGSGG